jgi:hypothetical protein
MIIPFAEYAPDRSRFDPAVTEMVKNVIPRVGGFGPFRKLQPFTDALPDVPRGAIFIRGDDGSSHIFAGTTTKLYKLNPSTLAWDDVSEAATTYALPNDVYWSFTHFGSQIIATNTVDGPQVYTIGSSTEFEELGGNPPNARVAGVVGDFVFLGEDAQSRRVTWSGVNNAAHWRPRQRLSDFQVFPDGNDIVGIVGFERGGLIFQRRAVREILPALDTTLVFRFQEVERDRGAIAMGSIINAGSDVFWLSEDGFYRYGRPSVSIGAERINNTFFSDIGGDVLGFVQGAADPVQHLVYWRYSSIDNNNENVSDKILVYNYTLNRWSVIEAEITWLMQGAAPGYTLETLDNVGTLDTLPYSLDSRVWVADIPNIAAFDKDYKLGFFSGDPMEATMHTADVQLDSVKEDQRTGTITSGQRAFVRGFRPVSDASQVFGRVAARNRSGANQVFGSEAQAQVNGLISTRSSGLYHRFEVRIPEGEPWNHINGIEPEWRSEGRR